MKEKAKMSVLQAATKWRKRRKSSVESIKDKVSSATRRRCRAPSLCKLGSTLINNYQYFF